MSSTGKTIDFSHLSVEERIRLAEEIWDSIVDEVDDGAGIELTDAQKAELDRRMDRRCNDPDSGSPWQEVRERIRSGLKE